MITNLEKNFEAIKTQQFVDEFKKKNKKKEKAIYFNSKQKLWVLSEKKTKKATDFIANYEETLPKKIKKKKCDNQEIKQKILSLWHKGYSVKEIHEETGVEKKKIYTLTWYEQNK